MFTDRDLKDQIIESLGGEDAEYSVQGICDEIQRKFGTVGLERIPGDKYWDIVQRHHL